MGHETKFEPRGLGSTWYGLRLETQTTLLLRPDSLRESQAALGLEAAQYILAHPHWQFLEQIGAGSEVVRWYPSVAAGVGLRWRPFHNFSLSWVPRLGNENFEPARVQNWFADPQFRGEWGPFSLTAGSQIYASQRTPAPYAGVGVDLFKIFRDEYEYPLPVITDEAPPLKRIQKTEVQNPSSEKEEEERKKFRQNVAALKKAGYELEARGVAFSIHSGGASFPLKEDLVSPHSPWHRFFERLKVINPYLVYKPETPQSLMEQENTIYLYAPPQLIRNSRVFISPIHVKIEEKNDTLTITLWNWLEESPFFQKQYLVRGREAFVRKERAEKVCEALSQEKKSLDPNHFCDLPHGEFAFPEILEEVGLALDNDMAHLDLESVAEETPQHAFLYNLVSSFSGEAAQTTKEREALFENSGWELQAYPSGGTVDQGAYRLVEKGEGAGRVYVKDEFNLYLGSPNLDGQVISVSGHIKSA